MNAIILAAGLGSRFGELTRENHKSLLPINGRPNIERTIEYLNDAYIHDITIITGHQSEKLSYLDKKYGCQLIYNEHYKDYNSIYSFKKALPFFHNSFVIDADVVLFDNIFTQKLTNDTYFLIQRLNNSMEWVPRLDKQGFIQEIVVEKGNSPSLLGVSYWTEETCNVIKDIYPQFESIEMLSNSKLYWDDIPRSIINQLKVKTIMLDNNNAGEMDNWEEYQLLLKK